jgi:hypothetical protein
VGHEIVINTRLVAHNSVMSYYDTSEVV